MSELRDRDAYWARLHERLDRRDDPFEDDALLDWMARHPDDARTALVLCESIAAAPSERTRRRVRLVVACGAGAAAVALCSLWLADRSASDASEPVAAPALIEVRVLAFEARSTAASGSFVEERVRDAAGERVTTIGADFATSRSPTVAAREPDRSRARAE